MKVKVKFQIDELRSIHTTARANDCRVLAFRVSSIACERFEESGVCGGLAEHWDRLNITDSFSLARLVDLGEFDEKLVGMF